MTAYGWHMARNDKTLSETNEIEHTLPPTFRADHPFVFLIRENSTGSILFFGPPC
jgi:serine protease inhibitor